MEQDKRVIYEESSGWRHPYEVEVDHWTGRWEYDSSYTTKGSAIANAERLLTEPGVYRVRVVQTTEEGPED